jgi:ABC-type nickel/cobalt efflux system permease component RcnA
MRTIVFEWLIPLTVVFCISIGLAVPVMSLAAGIPTG